VITDIPGNVRAAMGRRKVTVSELARRTGIPRHTVKYQLDSDTLSAENMVLIAQALDVDAAVLLAPVTPVTP
jgi:lambda repressor-like predicted transcriptional regulator